MDAYTSALRSAIADVVHSLGAFAADALFTEKFKLVFGTEITPRRFRTLTSGSALPGIEVVEDGVLAGALGGFSAQTGKIYLSQSLFEGDSALLRAVLLEEVGHYLDAVVNGKDTPGDEGELFSAIVRGEFLSSETIASIKAEDDSATIIVDGEVVEIEMLLNISSQKLQDYTGWFFDLAKCGGWLAIDIFGGKYLKIAKSTIETAIEIVDRLGEVNEYLTYLTDFAEVVTLVKQSVSPSISWYEDIRLKFKALDKFIDTSVGAVVDLLSMAFDIFKQGSIECFLNFVGVTLDILDKDFYSYHLNNYEEKLIKDGLKPIYERIQFSQDIGTKEINKIIIQFLNETNGINTVEKFENELKVKGLYGEFLSITKGNNSVGDSIFDGIMQGVPSIPSYNPNNIISKKYTTYYQSVQPVKDPNSELLKMPIFDANYYLRRYEDVANAYGSSNIEGAKSHWLTYGIQEGRRGSNDFDPAFYLANNPDVENAYGVKDYKGAISHYLNYGRPGGRAGAELGGVIHVVNSNQIYH